MARAMPDDLWTIRAMCTAFGVTPRTLRFYEARELISPRRDGQHRLYSRACRARMTLILQGKRFGFRLEDIRQLLDLYDPATPGQRAQIARSCALARERLGAMEAQRDELDLAIIDLRRRIGEAESLLEGTS